MGSSGTSAATAYAVVTGGGTSGHVLPALAIADALVERGHLRDDIHYAGTTRGIETTLLPPTGYPHRFFTVDGLQRGFSPRDIVRNVLFVPKLIGALVGAYRWLGRIRPEVVVNVGGYASVPASVAAIIRRVPLVVVSYDQRPGLVSRLLARRASAVAAAFEGSSLPRAEFTGAPIRRDIVRLDRSAGRDQACAQLDLPADRTIIAVMCGSLGAKVVNDAVTELIERWAPRRDLAVYHVVGERFVAGAAPARDGADGILYRVIGYESQMPLVYTAADLMVTRAGAGTLAELTAAGVPAVVVPWPGAAENHQESNARQLADIGAVELVLQSEISRLGEAIDHLVSDADARRELATCAAAAGAHHRSDRLIAVIELVAKR